MTAIDWRVMPLPWREIGPAFARECARICGDSARFPAAPLGSIRTRRKLKGWTQAKRAAISLLEIAKKGSPRLRRLVEEALSK